MGGPKLDKDSTLLSEDRESVKRGIQNNRIAE